LATHKSSWLRYKNFLKSNDNVGKTKFDKEVDLQIDKIGGHIKDPLISFGNELKA
jgi:hypothetical protein